MISESQVQLLKERKIPVDSWNPKTYWIICLDWDSLMPTEQELLQIQTYCEFIVKRTYNEIYQLKILTADLPKCGGHNTLVLRKGLWTREDHKESWFYRRISWAGCGYSPYLSQSDYKPHSLVDILDRCEHGSTKWSDWKSQHLEVFTQHTHADI